jgi:hypothetical protein
MPVDTVAFKGDINYQTTISLLVQTKQVQDYRLVADAATGSIKNRVVFTDGMYMDTWARMSNGRIEQVTTLYKADGEVRSVDCQYPSMRK